MDNPAVEKTLSMGHYGMLTLRRIMVLRLEAAQLSSLPVDSAIGTMVERISGAVGAVIAAEMELAAYIFFVATGKELPNEAAEQVHRMAEKYPEGMLFNMEIPMEMAYEIINANKHAYETNLASIQRFDVDEKTGKTMLEYGFPPVQELFQAYAQEWLRRQGDTTPVVG